MPNICDDLRAAILQAAMQGKLTKQSPEDGNASDLLEEIKVKKEKLIAEGRIKKQKALSPITEEEIPFNIPENWKWVRLGNISQLVTKGTTPRGGNVAYLDNGIGFLRAENVAGFDKINMQSLKYINEKNHNGFLKRSVMQAGDILITIAGTLGRTGLVSEEDLPLNANQAISIVRPVHTAIINLRYVTYALNTPDINAILTQQKKTTAIPNLTLEIIENCILPLPPLAEQKRIVEKVDELITRVAELEESADALVSLKKAFPDDIKASLLQYAMQGKLTKQLPEDGDAEKLYNQIELEKHAITKNGKAIKWNRQPKLGESELPYSIPDTWKWVRLGDIIHIESGNGLTSSQMKSGSIPVYGGNGITGYHNKSLLHKETIVIGRVGFYCGSVHVTQKESWVTDNAFITTYPENSIDREFLVYALRFMNLGQNNNATAQPVVSGKKIYPLPFPLPPLTEQKRIVERLNDLMQNINAVRELITSE